jgi:signal transduction histidine kinase
VAREAVSYIKLHYPKLNVGIQTSVPDSFCMQTSRMYLMRSLREILYNSAKYSDGQHVMLYVEAVPAGEGQTPTSVRFIVEDTGKGIAEADRELMFKFFAKVDDLSEGLGLGLPLAKRHARNLGGDLTLDVDYHDGCRFILELPILN